MRRFANDSPGIQLVPSSCPNCAWKRLGTATCEVFPAGIPTAILDGQHLYATLYPGDRGPRFVGKRLSPEPATRTR